MVDLTPIHKLALTRLIFTPQRIERGLGEVREMFTVQEIGMELETRVSPTVFWQRYDEGEIK